jgi:hypothetical protein
MALLTDGYLTTVAELQGIDAAVLDVARVERIDVEKKLSAASLEVELRIKKFVLDHGLDGRIRGADGEVDTSRVVATAGVKRWHALEALAMVYSDAYFSQLNDRYQAKWEHFRRESDRAKDLLFSTGIGGVSRGVKRAGQPVVTGNGFLGAEETYFISVAWRNESGVEGAPSVPVAYTSAEMPRVSAPEGSEPGWTFQVYAGTSDGTMKRQNEVPLAPGTQWMMTLGLVAGEPMGDGQRPEFYLRRERIWQRG